MNETVVICIANKMTYSVFSSGLLQACSLFECPSIVWLVHVLCTLFCTEGELALLPHSVLQLPLTSTFSKYRHTINSFKSTNLKELLINVLISAHYLQQLGHKNMIYYNNNNTKNKN